MPLVRSSPWLLKSEAFVRQILAHAPDHRPALRKLLRTILVTYDELLGALLVPPSHDPSNQQPPEYLQHLDWLRLNAINMIAAINELRPVQVSYINTPYLELLVV